MPLGEVPIKHGISDGGLATPAGRLPRGSAGPSSEDGKRETLRPAAGESGRVKTPKVLPRLSPGSPPGFFFVRATARGLLGVPGLPKGSGTVIPKAWGLGVWARRMDRRWAIPYSKAGHRGCKLSSLSFKDSKNSTIQKIC